MKDEVRVIAEGDTLPEATLLRIGANGPEQVSLHGLLKGRRVILFAVPGAYTPTCDSAHMPSFVRTAETVPGEGDRRDHLRVGQRRACDALLGAVDWGDGGGDPAAGGSGGGVHLGAGA